MEPGGSGRPRQAGFEEILELSVAEGLRNILGESGLQVVLSQCPLTRIASDPAVFRNILTDIFMEEGAIIIEREVARVLLEKTGKEIEPKRSQRPLAGTSSHGPPPGMATRQQKAVLRRFLELESLSKSHGTAKLEEPTIQLTAETFAYAFKKGN